MVLFLVDDMGWMDSSVYGSRYYQTPNMERLAKQSMRFTDAYALPLCSPTRASIMTGQSSSRHGITSATGHLPPQPPDFQFLPEFCRVETIDGALRMIGERGEPFLGTAQIKSTRPLELALTVRSTHGGRGKVWWKTPGQEQFPVARQLVEFELKATEPWQDVEVRLPIEQRTQIIRVYLPAKKHPVDIRSIRYSDAVTGTTVLRWDFSELGAD